MAAALFGPHQDHQLGLLGEAGIVAQPEYQEQIAQQGVGPILTAEGIEAFERILAADLSEVLPIKLLAGHHARLVAKMSQPLPGARPVECLLPATLHYLQRVFGEVLGIEAAAVRESQPHETLGIDSLVMLKIIRRLEQDLDRLPKTLLFEHRTVADLARRLVGDHAPSLERFLGERQVVASPSPPQALPQAPSQPRSFEADDDAIAVVGVAGRYPLAPTLDDLWENLRTGRDCITEVPRDRWDHRAYFDPDSDQKGKTYSKWGGFLDDVDKFDALFFGISPREANSMDPQERLFLEIAWATLEDAGYTRARLRERTQGRHGTDVGVFVGVMHGNYQLFGAATGDQGQLVGANSPYWSIANRVSYFFDFHGPSLAVDTACSSSLAAVHLACESLRRGECRAALAGGVNLLLHPRQYVILSQMKMLSRQGACRPFGAGADGIVPGEGVGAVLLRPLRDARRDGDRILGVIRGSAMNAGGRTGGYTVPNPTAQTNLVSAALEQAGVSPNTITCIEAHGTGTALGDPIEVAALTRALGRRETLLCPGLHQIQPGTPGSCGGDRRPHQGVAPVPTRHDRSDHSL